MVGCCGTAGGLARTTLLGGRGIRRACVHRVTDGASRRTRVATSYTDKRRSMTRFYLNHTTRHCIVIILALVLLALPAAGDTTYTVRPGDSVWSIAAKHDLSYLAVLRANKLATSTIIRPGQQLILPDTSASSPKSSSPASRSADANGERIHVVRRGESLWLIARRYNTSVRALAEANGRRAAGVLRVGSRLKIPGTSEAAEERSRANPPEPQAGGLPPPRTHFVRRGECLWTIARAYDTSVQALAAANGLRPEHVLRAGRQLTIPRPGGPRAAAEEPQEKLYVAKKGDSLWDIAHRHGTTVRALAETNRLDPDRVLRVGTILMVPSSSGSPAAAIEGQHRFVQAALQYRGVRYRYGGMSTRGMDCSGLVALVLRNYGINAPHNSKALYKLGEKVSRENLQPGDLVFFHTTRPGISHVGIYVGNGSFIHASSGKGRVRIDRMDQGYYRRRLVGAKRIS